MAAVFTLVVAGYFLVVSRVLEQFAVAEPVSPQWALVLLAPAGLLAARARGAYRAEGGGVFTLVLGSAALAAGALILADLLPPTRCSAWSCLPVCCSPATGPCAGRQIGRTEAARG
jgi:hypothetical protein